MCTTFTLSHYSLQLFQSAGQEIVVGPSVLPFTVILPVECVQDAAIPVDQIATA